MNDARGTTEAEVAPRLDDALATVVCLGLIGYLIASSVRIEMSVAMEIGYGLSFVAAVGGAAGLLILRRPLDTRVARVAQVAIVVSSVYLVPTALLPQGRTLRHVAVDFATTMLPIALLLAVCMAPAIATRILDRRWVLLFFLASLYSPFIVQDHAQARLFEPPNVGVIALLTGFACLRAGRRDGVAAVLGLMVLLALAALSGSRSVLLLGVSAFVVVVVANRPARRLAVLAVVIGAVVLVARPSFDPSSLRRDDSLRFLARATDLQGLIALDASPSSRVFEAREIFAEIGEGGPLWMAVGVGHGAVFQPSEWRQERTISADGFVHNVHVGPVLMLFRYGILGLGLYLFLLAHSGLVAFRSFPRQRPVVLHDLPRQRLGPHGALAFLFAFGTFLFLIEFLARNVLPNPMFSFFLAGHVAMTLQRRATTTQIDASAQPKGNEMQLAPGELDDGRGRRDDQP